MKEHDYGCRFHPTDWFHEVGCSHKTWTVEELQSALETAKRVIDAYIELIKKHPDLAHELSLSEQSTS